MLDPGSKLLGMCRTRQLGLRLVFAFCVAYDFTQTQYRPVRLHL